jgi:hypothetical protein
MKARIRQVLLVVPGTLAERHERVALATLDGTGCMDESQAHKSQILRVCRVNPIPSDVAVTAVSWFFSVDPFTNPAKRFVLSRITWCRKQAVHFRSVIAAIRK